MWVGFSCKQSEDGSQVLLLNRQDEGFAEALDSLMQLGGSLVSVMHTDIEDTIPSLNVVKERWSGPVGAYPHSGSFVMPNFQFDKIISPEDFLAEGQKWVRMGVQLVGSCCGIGPEHIRALREGLPTRIPIE